MFFHSYRLAPEHHYPAQLNDVMAVVNYVDENAYDLGINPMSIGIAGKKLVLTDLNENMITIIAGIFIFAKAAQPLDI